MLQKSDHREHEYWIGWKNKSIRYWFYISRGLDLFNNFRYVFMLIFGIYYTLKLHNYNWLILMFAVTIPILGTIGFYSVHHMGKIMDWLNVKFSTHYSMLQIDLLTEIRDGLLHKKDS